MSNLWQMRSWLISGSIAASSLLVVPFSAYSQMTPDTTLPNNSEVNTSNNTSTISGGTRVGDNLYHSLEQFSVPTGGTASFDNAADIQNIITRVTGSNVSNIDGLIRANGAANLFLLNPNGIVFGPNARLNIGGSFIGSTASSIDFADGNNFPAKPQQTQPLLSVNVPVGLQFNNNSAGVIQFNGNGSQTRPNPRNNTPTTIGDSSTGLSVQPGKTLALVGSNIDLRGGILTSVGGRIELGSIGNGSVKLQSAEPGWGFGYEDVSDYNDIGLSGQTLVNASGSGSGSIQVHGANVAIGDGSLALIQNTGQTPSGTLNINATQSLALGGTSPDGTFSSLRTEVASSSGQARGANITISTPQLVLRDAARILANTYGDAPGGSVTINAANSIQLLESTSADSFNIIGASTYSSANAGKVHLSTPQLSIFDGGTVASSTFGTGAAGDITVNSDTVDIVGTKRIVGVEQPTQSNIVSSSVNAGNAGRITVNTSKLKVIDGAAVNSSSLATGNAGSIIISATESVEVSQAASPSRRSFITSSVSFDPTAQRIFRLSSFPSGLAGDVTINTPVLNVNSGGLVSVRNQGTGHAGTLRITATDINLDNSGSITAASASGQGGNITLNSGQLGLRSSEITASAGNNGNGGNIDIDTGTLTGTSDSRIVADAQQGSGGNININAQGVFFPRQNITASSQLGINGNIQIQLLIDNLVGELVELPQQPTDASQQIVSCPPEAGPQASSFTVTGKGGLPDNPYELLSADPVSSNEDWLFDDNPPSGSSDRQSQLSLEQTTEQGLRSSLAVPYKAGATKPLVEADSWVVKSNGEVVLLAAASHQPKLSSPQCHAF